MSLFSRVVTASVLIGLLVLVSDVLGEANYNTVGLRRHQDEELSWSYAHMHEWEGVCQTGKIQSPISLMSLDAGTVEDRDSLPVIEFSSRCHLSTATAQAVISNVDYGIHMQFVLVKGGKMKTWESCLTRDPITGMVFRFHELDFHVGPEHRLPEVRTQAELHIKFRAVEERGDMPFLYFSVPLQVGSSGNTSPADSGTELLDRLLTDGRLPPIDAMISSSIPRHFTIFELLPTANGYYTYNGSLTQPPCTEGVRWVVFTTPLEISTTAFSALQESIAQSNSIPMKLAGNARTPQPLHGRTVLRYPGGESHWVEEKELRKQHRKNASTHGRFAGLWRSLQHQLTGRGMHWKGMELVILVVAVLIAAALLLTACRRWRQPGVVGINPRDLQPLVSSEERRGFYGAA